MIEKNTKIYSNSWICANYSDRQSANIGPGLVVGIYLREILMRILRASEFALKYEKLTTKAIFYYSAIFFIAYCNVYMKFS